MHKVLEAARHYSQHSTAGQVSGSAVAALTVNGDGNEDHFLRPPRDLAANENVANEFPGATSHGRRVALGHYKVGGLRKGHPPDELLVNGFDGRRSVIGL